MNGILSIEQKLGYTWIVLPDSIHMDNYRQLEAEIGGRVSESANRVVLDFCNTKALYSSGIGMMIRLRRRLSEVGGRMCCVNVSGKIRALLESVRLDTIFPIYSTDVEFEISQDDVWQQKLSEQNVDFVFVAQIEDTVYRINCSGQLITGLDLQAFKSFKCVESISWYVFDLTGLEVMDSFGAQIFMEVLLRIKAQNSTAIAYGAQPQVRDFLSIMSIDDHLVLCDNERLALEAIGKA
ncbi:MAG: STAS domain-containing protein [Chitinivibrionales bacterium]|nr:STAS domain-containing protein [Chitinivibrionales bacterium]